MLQLTLMFSWNIWLTSILELQMTRPCKKLYICTTTAGKFKSWKNKRFIYKNYVLVIYSLILIKFSNCVCSTKIIIVFVQAAGKKNGLASQYSCPPTFWPTLRLHPGKFKNVICIKQHVICKINKINKIK